ncbi:MAG: peptide transporter [Caulobacter sp.]|nr:peptide transporter [Caulobacter sp.]
MIPGGNTALSATEPVALGKTAELTLRGLILGAIITLVFTAANVYLGLKVGSTFATSIPAAVISMAILRMFKGVTIQENNIVQTVASAAGALASVIFVLPGLIMVGWWTGFPFWMCFGICAIGGTLGVMYSIPLRRALVTNSDLPYPEGVAAAEVLKVGSGGGAGAEAAGEGKAGLAAIVAGSVVSAIFPAVVGMRLFVGDVAKYFKVGAGATGFGGSLSMALIGAGHLMGIAVGMAQLVGVIIAWCILVPMFTAMHPAAGPTGDWVQGVFHGQIRMIGAGAIGAAALWTLFSLIGPVVGGLRSAMATQAKVKAGGGGEVPLTDRDLPISWVAGVSIALMIPIAFLTWKFLAGGLLDHLTVPLVLLTVVYVTVAGFMISAVCGYMAGLVGSSTSPVSGLAILGVLGASLLLSLIVGGATGDVTRALVAFALFITSLLIAVAVVANDNLQDLKTGQLVGATPWKQQVALIIGSIAGSLMIPPILDLLNKAYGFAGAPGVHGIAANPLEAPQATLISTLARGVLERNLDWGLIGLGAAIGIALVVVDRLLRRTKRYSLPPLAVGMAIYLPSSLIIPTVCGAVIGWVYNKWVGKGRNGAAAIRLGVLSASGLIVGESLFNVLLAGLIVGRNNPSPLAFLGEDPFKGLPIAGLATWAGLIGFVVMVGGLYIWTRARALSLPSGPVPDQPHIETFR